MWPLCYFHCLGKQHTQTSQSWQVCWWRVWRATLSRSRDTADRSDPHWRVWTGQTSYTQSGLLKTHRHKTHKGEDVSSNNAKHYSNEHQRNIYLRNSMEKKWVYDKEQHLFGRRIRPWGTGRGEAACSRSPVGSPAPPLRNPALLNTPLLTFQPISIMHPVNTIITTFPVIRGRSVNSLHQPWGSGGLAFLCSPGRSCETH